MAPPLPTAGQGVDIRVKYLNQGELCYNNFSYYPEDTVLLFDSAALVSMAQAFDAQVLSSWINCVTDEVRFVDLLLTVRGANNNGRTYTHPLTAVGQVVGDTLPVYNTISLKKIPQLSDQLPVGSDPFKAGRIPISGVPEQTNSEGAIAAVALPSLLTLADALLNFNITAPVNTTMHMRMVDNPVGVDPRQVPVEDIVVNRLGTQLTRKN